jgi:hypothetical protein
MADFVYINEDGATCPVPEGANVAPFDPLWNPNGMSEFCVFPFEPLKRALVEQLEATPFDLEECDALAVSPSVQEFPCYEIRYE